MNDSYRRTSIRLVRVTSEVTIALAGFLFVGALAMTDGCNARSGGASSLAPSTTVVDPAAKISQLTITSPLALGASSLLQGQTLSGRVQWTNTGTWPVSVRCAAIVAIPPGGSPTTGPWIDLNPINQGASVAPGATLSIQASRAIASTDPTGSWTSYAEWQDSGGSWHVGPTVPFTVSAPPPPSLAIASPLALSASSVAQGGAVHASVTYTNASASGLGVKTILVTTRPPGGTHAGGPYDDCAPSIGATMVSPGASVAVVASRTILATDPTGTWEAYSTYEDSSGVWHDGPSVSFTVVAPARPIWVTGYYGAWSTTKLPPASIDFTALTHISHFAVLPRSDGSLDTAANGTISAATASALIGPAHAAGTKVLLCVGGGGTYTAFNAAVQDAVRPTLVANLVGLVRQCGYDGIDIDYEPLPATDAPVFGKLVSDLRAALGPASLLTAAVPIDAAAVLAPVQGQLDQVNAMTYDMGGLWAGSVTWFNSPLWDGGLTFPSNGAPIPCVDSTARAWVAAGLAKAKLGIGCAFYGTIWNGATGPDQSIANVTGLQSVEYSTIMDSYYTAADSRWDTTVEAPYLAITAGSGQFVSYDDENLVASKTTYARTQGLGGIIIWNLGSGFRPSQPTGSQDTLLQAVKRAAASP